MNFSDYLMAQPANVLVSFSEEMGTRIGLTSWG